MTKMLPVLAAVMLLAACKKTPAMPSGFEMMQVAGTDGTGDQLDLSKSYADYSLTVGQIVKILSAKPDNKLSWVTLPNGNGWVLHVQSPSNDPRTNYRTLMDLQFAPTKFDGEPVALMGLDVNGNDGSLQIIDMLKGMSDGAAKNNIH
jgi:hypothetical protein